ncbi:ComEA family DNA-binding protein [Nakamurella sp.]|uniref:ComEA family DNA-binding protein n=1 Tax=Nakamurella sp. TaxID=1869182 RepID=UPI003783A2A4
MDPDSDLATGTVEPDIDADIDLGVDTAPDADADLGADEVPDPEAGEPARARVHRINGRWGRFAELWVPESMREARVDPGRRGMLVLVLVAAVAAVVAAVGVWRDRPEPRPIETAVVAAASGPLAAPVSEAAASPAAAVGAAGTAGVVPVSGSAGAPVTEILVSVTGLVASPGVVRLAPEARVADAIAAAGGTQPGADLTGMNLAAKLADGDSVVVSDTASTAAASGGGPAGGSGGAATQPAGGLVNLNTADEAALDTLPGVGPVMAQNILAWRETNGKFSSIEQLQEISGIGPSRYAQLAPLVTVG